VNTTAGNFLLVRITSNNHLFWACAHFSTPSDRSHFPLSHTFRIFHTSNPLELPTLLHLHSSHTIDPLTLPTLLHSSTPRPLVLLLHQYSSTATTFLSTYTSHDSSPRLVVNNRCLFRSARRSLYAPEKVGSTIPLNGSDDC
jgi:hypothetical protein